MLTAKAPCVSQFWVFFGELNLERKKASFTISATALKPQNCLYDYSPKTLFFLGGDSMSYTAEELLNDNTAERLLWKPKQSKTSFWDRIFPPKHKLMETEKQTRKTIEKIERKKYYP